MSDPVAAGQMAAIIMILPVAALGIGFAVAWAGQIYDAVLEPAITQLRARQGRRIAALKALCRAPEARETRLCAHAVDCQAFRTRACALGA